VPMAISVSPKIGMNFLNIRMDRGPASPKRFHLWLRRATRRSS
jgi:hypothetical protein